MKTSSLEIIRNFFSPRQPQDVARTYRLFAEDVLICDSKQLPWGGCYRGLQGVGNLLSRMAQSILAEVQLEKMYLLGGQIHAEGRSWGRALATGKRFDVRIAQRYTFNENNKISHVEIFSATPALLE
ncbi:MAG: nuclear transport factor 2 family protein, partial [Bacteroidota bacterium]